MSDKTDLQTEHAARGTHLKTTFDTAVKGIFTGWVAELTAPEETTGGGIRARQHIRLVAKDGKHGPAVVVGAANAAEKTAEVQTLGCVLEVSKQRFGVELSIPAPEYIAFQERATDVLRVFGLTVSVISSARQLTEEPKKTNRPPA